MPETPAPVRRGPGLALLIVLLYAAAFGAGLLWFRSRSPLFHRVAPSPRRPVAPSPPPPLTPSPTPSLTR